MKRLSSFALILTLMFSQSFAASNEAQDSPVYAIQKAIASLNQITQSLTYSPESMEALVLEKVVPLFDFGFIANEVLLVMPSNQQLSNSEAQYFALRLKNNMINTLLYKLVQSQTLSLSFVSAKPELGGKISVKLNIRGLSQQGVYFDLWFHKNTDNHWQIFDIVLNEDSLIKYYQASVMIKVDRLGMQGMLQSI
ncbi:MAG: ABC transporter substrate-binding protein [Gammaproteobacteria bacterium]